MSFFNRFDHFSLSFSLLILLIVKQGVQCVCANMCYLTGLSSTELFHSKSMSLRQSTIFSYQSVVITARLTIYIRNQLITCCLQVVLYSHYCSNSWYTHSLSQLKILLGHSINVCDSSNLASSLHKK